MKVYLVEESPLIRSHLAAMLREIGGVAIVGEAAEPAVALVGIAETQPDVIVLDLQLSGGSGLDVLSELKYVAPDAVPIVLTNYALPQFRRKCLAAGARYFFDKSHEFNEVKETVIHLTHRQDL